MDTEASSGSEIQSPQLIEAMLRPGFYPHACEGVELYQTVTSWLLFAGQFVYKVKKPLHFPFLDAMTPARRYRLCRDEVMLSRRLAPDVYLGIRGIAEENGSYTLAANAGGRKCNVREFAVVMRRLPDEQRLERMVLEGGVSANYLRPLVRRLVEFRAAAPIAKSKIWGGAPAISRTVLGNLAEAREIAADNLTRDELAVAGAYARRYLIAHQQSLDNRARDGYVREGHGQLRCDKVFFAGAGITIIDCAEFAEGARYCDAASEIASLAVSLDMLERPDLADELQREYVRATGDQQLPDLLRFYKCYRAVLQGKLETLASLQTALGAEQRIAARGKARRLFALAAEYARA